MFLQDYLNLYNRLRKNLVQRLNNGTEELMFSKTILFYWSEGLLAFQLVADMKSDNKNFFLEVLND